MHDIFKNAVIIPLHKNKITWDPVINEESHFQEYTVEIKYNSKEKYAQQSKYPYLKKQ